MWAHLVAVSPVFMNVTRVAEGRARSNLKVVLWALLKIHVDMCWIATRMVTALSGACGALEFVVSTFPNEHRQSLSVYQLLWRFGTARFLNRG